MQQRFLATVQHLDSTALLSGLWLIHSDEPLMQQWFIDACRPSWQTHAQVAKRIELSSPKSWQAVLNELSALSLFAESSVIIISGKQKLDNATLAELTRFSEDAKLGNTQHQLIWLLPKQDKKSQSTKAFKLFENQGVVIDANIYNEKERLDLLKFQATRLGLSLDNDAWQTLMSHTEHDLLAAYQNLWRLSYLHAAAPHDALSEQSLAATQTAVSISLTQLIDALSEGGRFSVFDLSDALIAKNAQDCLKIINHLAQTDSAPSIALWALAKDIRLIAGVKAGKDPLTLGIWRNKVSAYQRMAHSLSDTLINQALIDVYEIDKAIKGLTQRDPWQLIQKLTLTLCGIPTLLG